MDFYGAPARAAAEKQLAECEALLEGYANEVFEREQNAKAAPSQKSTPQKKAAPAKMKPKA